MYTREIVNKAIEYGDIYTVKKSINNGTYPDRIDRNLTTEERYIRVLDLLYQYNLLPKIDYLGDFISKHQLDILNWFKEHYYQFTVRDANTAVLYGYMDILILFSKDNIYPDKKGANIAVGYEYKEIQEWLKNKNILPD